jgi:uncharacterized protein with HEPN domain
MLPDLQRIRHIYDYCAAIEKTIQRYGNSYDIFLEDEDFQRSIAFSILQIGELSSGLSPEYRERTAQEMQWGPIKGMRNWVAHNYGNVSYDVLWETATVDIPNLKEFCQRQLKQYR